MVMLKYGYETDGNCCCSSDCSILMTIVLLENKSLFKELIILAIKRECG